MIRIAVFADIHGKFLLPFKLVQYYQNITGQKIDWILQCGDMGAFPEKSRMDKATLRHAQADRDELGFMDQFVTEKAEIATFLNELNINMLCVRGNHEDHLFLDELEQLAIQQQRASFSIDAYKRVWVCRSGIPIILEKEGETLSIVGVGRIGDQKGRIHPPFIQDYERKALKQLMKKHQEFDVLLSHDKASESQRGYGAEEISQLLNQVAFSYHFYGHTGEPYQCTLADNGITQSVKISELEFDKKGKLSEGCMLILEKNNQNLSINTVPLKDIIHFMHSTWQFL
ncbi:MAG: metallophosphoesterase [Acinetobacter tjernbergiae]